ncbi:MAG TPA: hypothetical protein VN664_01985 [Burkholderiales bacterium]|jgi:hypothetical protein|nr:hypothetical protein [Burkholderiales bacterium]
MNKCVSSLAAAILVLSANGFAFAENESPIPQATQQDTQIAPGQGGDLSAKEQEYLVALTKCESLTGSQKTACIETAKKKFGQM